MENYYYQSCSCGFVVSSVFARIYEKIRKDNLREKIQNGDKDQL